MSTHSTSMMSRMGVMFNGKDLSDVDEKDVEGKTRDI